MVSKRLSSRVFRDFGELINTLFQAIKAVYMKKKGWSEEQVEQQVLRKYNESEVTNFTEFDRLSIMMYDLPILSFIPPHH